MTTQETFIFSGSAQELAPMVEARFSGGVARLSKIMVPDHIAYAQAPGDHRLQAVISGWSGLAAGQANAVPPSRRELRGSLSFTPAGYERRGGMGRGTVTGLEIALEHGFLEDACEQRLRKGFSLVCEGRDAKTSAITEMLAASAGGPPDLLRETLMVVLARRLGYLYGGATVRHDDSWLHPHALARVIDLLRSEPGKNHLLSEIAGEAGLGISAFIRAFRGATGVTPASYAKRVRLDHAASLLRTTAMPIRQVASECAFSSAAHLIAAFRNSYGVTPAEWRRGPRRQCA